MAAAEAGEERAEAAHEGERFIRRLTPALEERIRRNPSLNTDIFIVPTPFVEDAQLEKDYEHSYVWDEEGELLGYIQVYSDPPKERFHIYKQVTGPFGRGKGVGTAFLSRLAREISPDALVYLYVWEKLDETVLFFANKGFATEDRIVYRNLVFNRMAAAARTIATAAAASAPAEKSVAEGLGSARHDARKALRLLSDMVDTLSIDNAKTIIEGINRETTALVNLLNDYRDTVEYFHEVNVRDLILERILPLIELSPVPCEVRLSLTSRIPEAYGHYLDVGRALVNLISNSLDAIREAGRKGCIGISLEEKEERVFLSIEDNGSGIEPALLAPGPDGLPLFVGRTTKGKRTGEGIGTRQIYAAFGAENIEVHSVRGVRTRWTIQLPLRPQAESAALRGLENRYRTFQQLMEPPGAEALGNRSVIGSFIWQTRSMEILSWDLIFLFSKYNNVREIFRAVLAYRYGAGELSALKEEIGLCRVDDPRAREWLLDIAGIIKRNETFLSQAAAFLDFGGMLFKSYGQATGKTVIFTLDPETGRFHATDRRLAEHVDFIPFLGKPRDELLRGEFNGDVKNPGNPLILGVWAIRGDEDAITKLALIRRGCRTLITMGIKPEKRLVFYQTTYREGPVDLDRQLSTTLAEVAGAADGALGRFLANAGEDDFSFIVTD